ncbi:MAG TPA: hypothetical protein VGJ74_16155 [Burkholderiales bacterium]|jgi:hypothetical protein
MANFLTARIPPRVEQRLAEYCVKHGMTRSEAVVRALDQYLEVETGVVNAAALAADLIPRRGTRRVQSDRARELVRKTFARRRAR